jgi:hypothetical protein
MTGRYEWGFEVGLLDRLSHPAHCAPKLRRVSGEGLKEDWDWVWQERAGG